MAEFYRIGRVDQVNDDYTCNVWFDDIELLCEHMQVMNRGTRNRDNDLPNKDDTVCCLFVPPFMSDGIILGCVYTEQDTLPDGDMNAWMKVFPDGSLLMYNDGVITIESTDKVNINATTININGKLVINGNPYLEHKHTAGNLKDGDSKPVTGSSGGVA